MVKRNRTIEIPHSMPADFKKLLTASPHALAAWQKITQLARNEWICWIISVKKAETRQDHMMRAVKELKAGKRRPCCWYGCPHRADKSVSRTQKFVSSY